MRLDSVAAGIANLVFVLNPEKNNVQDFCDVASRVVRLTSNVRPHVITTRRRPVALMRGCALALRPTLTIAIDKDTYFRPLRGRLLAHRGSGGKLLQYQRMAEAGLPVPRWVEIRPDTVLDPVEWGPYVVVKPSRGRRGAFVRVQKTGRVRYRPPEELPEDHLGRRAPMLAQKFIYTGRWPVAYRVMTYFGRPVLAIRYDGRREMAPLASAADFAASGGRSIVAAALGATVSLNQEGDVLELARRTHDCFPDNPSLGIDIVREQPSGMLYLMEINPSGNSWMLTNDDGRRMQADFELDFYAQFGALDVIARRSIELVHERTSTVA